MIEVKKASKCRRCNCCMSVNDVKEVSFWSEWNGTTVALCRECREAARMALTEPQKQPENVTDLFDRIKKAYYEACRLYYKQPEVIYMTPELFQKLKEDAEKRGFLAPPPPCPYIARIFGARIELIDAPGDLAFFGTLAVGKPIVE